MSDSAIIVTSHEFTESEFLGFLEELDGFASPLLRGSVSEGESTVWVGLLYIKQHPDLYEESLVDWEGYLGGPPISVLEMRLDHTQGAHELCVKIAFEFGRQWPMILMDSEGIDVSYDMVCERYTKLKDTK